ncbi:uncharacterized protein LOC6578494 [Drosophila mojavensis]|uniref:Uncharacterized protein n=1 Tax=Drosophila mojavensis TaxID=7230 RepID=B4KRR9_DROMO|nr:uncharacterized protein LOC6578494 [Drosophila mojavensis]EDW08339.1 uncharacterized protein Dmoj_GI19634 [Drosophila mojavensis]
MDPDKAEQEADAGSGSSNEDTDEDVDIEDIEESPRGRKSVSSIIAEMAIRNEQEAANSSSKKEDEQKRMELTRLSPAAMAAYIRELEAELYELSQREARELSRSKHLRIFGNNRRRSSK